MRHIVVGTTVILVAFGVLLTGCGPNGTNSGGKPTINSFSASPASITSGASSTLSWDVTGGDSLTINNGVGDVTGSSSASVSPTTTTTYTLTATNTNGNTTATTTVTVTTGGNQYSELGFVGMSESSTSGISGGTVEGNGYFVALTSPQTLPNGWNPYADQLGTCFVYSFGGTDPAPNPIDVTQWTTESAGNALSLTDTSDSSTYGTLDQTTVTIGADSFIVYADDGSLAYPLPTGLTVDVPGAAFPAFSGVSFPSAPAPDLSATNTTLPTVDLTTEFTWTSQSNPGLVRISGFGTNAASEVKSFDCVAEDTGSFTFPADTQTALGSGFSGSVTSAARTTFATTSSGTTLLVTSTEREVDYIP